MKHEPHPKRKYCALCKPTFAPPQEPTKPKKGWDRLATEEKLKRQIDTALDMIKLMAPTSRAELDAVVLPNLVSFMYEELTQAVKARELEIWGNIGEMKAIEIFYGNPRGDKMIYLSDLKAIINPNQK